MHIQLVITGMVICAVAATCSLLAASHPYWKLLETEGCIKVRWNSWSKPRDDSYRYMYSDSNCPKVDTWSYMYVTRAMGLLALICNLLAIVVITITGLSDAYPPPVSYERALQITTGLSAIGGAFRLVGMVVFDVKSAQDYWDYSIIFIAITIGWVLSWANATVFTCAYRTMIHAA